MAPTILSMRHSNLGRNHLQTVRWFRAQGWRVQVTPDGYRFAHDAFGTLPAPIELEIRPFPSSDMDALQQVFIEMQYLPAVQTMLQHSPNCANPVIVDGGANIGLCSIFLSRLFPQHRMLAVEPFPPNAAQTKKNLLLAGANHVQVYEGALWGRPALLELNLEHGDRREWAASVKEGGSLGEIRGSTVPDLCERYFPGSAIDLLKLDIEGAEFSVLNDSATHAFVIDRVRVLTLEVHPGFGDAEALLDRYRPFFAFEKSGEGFTAYNRNAT